MNNHDTYLAMILANAKRADASALLLVAEPAPARIAMLMPDGESKPFPAPPGEIVRGLIELLEAGEREFAASVYSACVQEVEIDRAAGRLSARIGSWSIEH